MVFLNFFIVFMLPSILGLKLFMNFNRDKKIFDYIVYYLLFTVCSNFIAMGILILFNKGELNLIEYSMSNFIFCTKYMFILFVINSILSILFTIISKYFVFTIEVENEKINTRKNNKANI